MTAIPRSVRYLRFIVLVALVLYIGLLTIIPVLDSCVLYPTTEPVDAGKAVRRTVSFGKGELEIWVRGQPGPSLPAARISISSASTGTEPAQKTVFKSTCFRISRARFRAPTIRDMAAAPGRRASPRSGRLLLRLSTR
ncbi:MAG TPA: hypothetical protein VK673_07670 [Chthoniobacterales bacterium]|nr:hypothetical protein [Chthoniobacterales bacterium]